MLNFRNVFSTIALAASAFAAMPAATAATVAVTVTGMEYANPVSATIHWVGSNRDQLNTGVYAGAFNATINNVALEAWCVDIFQQTTFGTKVNNYSSTASSTLGSTKVSALQDLATEALNQVGDAKTSAAFQLAIWEIVNETGSTYNLSTGSFSASNLSNNTVLGLAQTWLDKLPATSNVAFDLWVSPTQQDLISFKAAATSVPEPGTSAIIGLGLLGVALSRRRAGKQPAA